MSNIPARNYDEEYSDSEEPEDSYDKNREAMIKGLVGQRRDLQRQRQLEHLSTTLVSTRHNRRISLPFSS